MCTGIDSSLVLSGHLLGLHASLYLIDCLCLCIRVRTLLFAMTSSTQLS